MDDRIKAIALDLDGTLTQHKQPLSAENRAALDMLAQRYRLVIVGAGQPQRIFRQIERYPIDIIGNYGLQYAKYNCRTHELELVRDLSFPCDRESVERRVTALREKYGYTEYRGQNVEYHPSGCLTFPLLGTDAEPGDKLAFDPDRVKRRRMYADVASAFPEYAVFIGGSSSFDMALKPYDKYHALDLYCRENGLGHQNVIYAGDYYGCGGNDESVYKSDFGFIKVDDYRQFPRYVEHLIR
mgnify:CR=1 FL=1